MNKVERDIIMVLSCPFRIFNIKAAFSVCVPNTIQMTLVIPKCSQSNCNFIEDLLQFEMTQQMVLPTYKKFKS